MSASSRSLRALVLALVLPVLLVPSGWSARLCLCALEALGATEGCCATPAPLQPQPETSCCSSDELESGDAAGPAHAMPGACDGGSCGTCCRLVEAGDVELAWTSVDGLRLPALALAPCGPSSAIAPRVTLRAQRACLRSLAPPRVSTPLPLRI